MALFQLLFLKCIIHFELRCGILAIGVAYLVAELVYFLLLFVPLYGVAAVLRIGEVVGFILLVWLRYQAPEPAGAPCEQGSLSGSVFGGAPLPAVLAFIVCLTLSWGLFAQMTGDGAAAFFDATSEIVMVAVRAPLLIACLAVGTKVRLSNLAPLCAALWALGILAVGLLWGSVAVSASALIIKAGLYALQEFSLIVLTADAHERPRCFMFNAGLVLCALMSAHISRLIVLAMHGNSPVIGNDAIALIAVASGLVVAALLVVNRVETARVLCGPCGLGDAADGPGRRGPGPGCHRGCRRRRLGRRGRPYSFGTKLLK